MQHSNRLIVLIPLIIAGLLFAGCNTHGPEKTGEKPALVEAIDGSEFNRVTLSEKAAQRLDIQTEEVREEQVDGTQQQVLPYAALLYGLNGETWAYTNPEPLTYVRQLVAVDYIDADRVFLVDGPPSGTKVVTVGAAELFGADTGVGK